MAFSLNTTSSTGQEKGWIPLMFAAEAGDINTLTELLSRSSDIDIDARDWNGCTSLEIAAEKGHVAVVERLLVHNANPNLSDLDQITPLWKAARYGHAPVVQLLLTDGNILDVNQRSVYLHKYDLDTPDTPLSIALKQGHKEAAELLSRTDGINPCLTATLSKTLFWKKVNKCNLGHDTEDPDGDGADSQCGTTDIIESPSKLLVLAAAHGCSKIAKELLNKHSADVNAVHEYYAGEVLGWFMDSPLVAASRRGNLKTVRLLLAMDEIRMNVSSNNGDTALTAAAQAGFADVVKVLITDGRIEVDYENHGRTALSFAAESGSEATVYELLATRAANPNSQDNQARTPLIWAVDPGRGYGPGGWQAYEGVVRMLLANSKIAVNSNDSSGWTALLYAAKNGALGLVMALLEHPQIDPMAGPENASPLTEAAMHGHADVIRALISVGQVDVNAIRPCMFGRSRTALMIAVQHDRIEYKNVTQVLLSTPGIDVNFQDEHGTTALMLAALANTLRMDKFILNSRRITKMRYHNDNTGLCSEYNIEIMRAILDHPGIKPDLRNNEGRTALSLAAEAANIEHVKALLALDDVDPDARDIHGRGPLSWVFEDNGLQISWKKEERKAVLQQLLRLPSVDPNAEDHNGLTPLLLAIKYYEGHEYVEILLSRPDLDVDRPRADGADSPLDTAKQTGNMATVLLLRARGASESAVVESSFSCPEYPMFEYTQPQQRQRMFVRRSSSSGSETSLVSCESNFDCPPDLSRGLMRTLRNELLGEHNLRLGSQQRYVDEWVESRTSLCSSCSAIDLGSAFRTRHTKYQGRVIADLGRVDETWTNTTCSLCRLFAAVYSPTRLEEGHKLTSFSTTQSWLCHTQMNRWYDFQSKHFVDTMLLAMLAADSMVSDEPAEADENWSIRAEDVVKAVFSSGLIGRLGRNGPDQGSVTIPRLPTEISDWSAARGWINLCRENHSWGCNPRKAAAVPHFFLIDCSRRQVIEQKESQSSVPPPYVALSYVWGQSQGIQKPPQRQKQQESLDGIGDGIVEPAIEDAIRVTLELGYKYLWVDRYCIIQTGDEAIKQEQLRHMHLVYANAEVTLIAAAGKDSSAGLPGVPGRPRNQQPGALIQGHALVCIPPDPSLHIRSRSIWATRGWTYQEGLLARRRIFFSEYEMSYECRHMLCREAIRLPRGLEQRISGYKPRFMEPFWMYKPYRLPGMDSSETGIGLFDLLAVYTKRNLSLPSDTLNAMLGIFSLLAQRKTKPVYHICGVPILRLTGRRRSRSQRRKQDPTASGGGGDTEVAAAESLGGFLDGLCWRLDEPAHRRPGFPSWSWTGWQGVVAAMSNYRNAIKQSYGLGIDISIIPGNQDGGVAVPWGRCYDSLRMVDDSNPDIRTGQNHVLEITASAVTVRFCRGEYNGRPDTWVGTVCAGHGVWQGEFFLTSKDVPVSSLLQEPWTGIVLGNSESKVYGDLYDTTVVVIQEQKNGQQRGNMQDYTYCERVGLLHLVPCTLEANCAVGVLLKIRS
ncbi:ankyrin repeat-containing protein [Fusarium mundagurra]|uniref:Ankyrin repeat-containing protein n=1 Tax=Fusarium mundagurra TaxID=1567541 RepID=A0A8H6D4U3_9HYPO|nr:ankyrin repeat-containing protein [Fusarium mundagurra]